MQVFAKSPLPNSVQILAWTLSAVMLLAINTECQAQQIIVNGANKDAMRKQLVDQLAQKKLDATRRIACRIADINQACQLSTSQVKKLEVAAKGAVVAAMKQVKAKVDQQAKMMGVELDQDEVAEEKEQDNVPANGPRFAANFAFRGGFAGGPMGEIELPADKQKIWTKSLDKILTEEQSKQWDKWIADRLAWQSKMAVGNFVAKVDRRLLLSKEQRERITSYLSENHGELLLKRAGENRGGGFAVLNAFNFPGAKTDDQADSQMKEVLSEDQLAIWVKEFASQLKDNQIGGRIINLNVNQAPIIINRAVNGVVEINPNQDDDDDENQDDDN